MTLYTKEFLEKLKGKVDLVEVLSNFMTLSNKGKFYKGCCPFHEEENPSFTINQERTRYHCYGCDADGDALGFLMSKEKMSFSEAIEYLAKKYDMTLEVIEKKPRSEDLDGRRLLHNLMMDVFKISDGKLTDETVEIVELFHKYSKKMFPTNPKDLEKVKAWFKEF